MTLPGALHGRTAALAALAGAALTLALLVGLSLYGLLALGQGDATDTVRQLAFARAETAARPQVEAALRQLRAQIATLPGLIHGAPGAQAAASVQSAMTDIVSSAGGEIRSAQVLPSVTANGFEIVSVQYDLTVPMNRLRDLSYGIETHAPYLFIDTADIAAPVNWDPKAANLAAPTLEVRWVVRGYRWAGEK